MVSSLRDFPRHFHEQMGVWQRMSAQNIGIFGREVKLRRVARFIWFCALLAVLATVPYIVVDFRKSGYSTHYTAFVTAGLFVLLACPVAFYEAREARTLASRSPTFGRAFSNLTA